MSSFDVRVKLFLKTFFRVNLRDLLCVPLLLPECIHVSGQGRRGFQECSPLRTVFFDARRNLSECFERGQVDEISPRFLVQPLRMGVGRRLVGADDLLVG